MTEYFECMLVPLGRSELTCVTPTDYSQYMVGQNLERSKLDCVTHTDDDSEHSTISTLQESDCVTHTDYPTVLLGTDPLDDIYYDTVSGTDCVTHTDYPTVLLGTDPLDDIYSDTHTTVSITPVLSPSLRATFANHFIAFRDSIEVDQDLDNYHDCTLSGRHRRN